jgi:hypothetical protein
MARIRGNNEFQLSEMKDCIGFNVSALKMLMRSYEARHNSEFFGDEYVAGIEVRGKKGGNGAKKKNKRKVEGTDE